MKTIKERLMEKGSKAWFYKYWFNCVVKGNNMIVTAEMDQRDKMLARLSKLQAYWMKLGHTTIVIKINYIRNLYEDNRLDHKDAWELYLQYNHNYGHPIPDYQSKYFPY
jgi:hypothetical protein